MTPENWQTVKDILASALALAAAERTAFLDAACGADEDLRKEVEAFLEFEKQEEAFLKEPAFSFDFFNAVENDSAQFIDKQIGNYKLIREIGLGGMGAVFLAERIDAEFTQRVAVKLIKGSVNSRETIRRFQQERQILASLEHPFIARLIDGGTTGDGVPYFVMEYIEGLPIIEYAEVHNLDLEARLNLFRQICRAVEYAHRSLIVHRDLKPSNILIAADGTPKLLDFGIAKILKDDGGIAATRTRQFAFTPEYASPEQLRGENLTTAADIYSLGVILYELLTGSSPYQIDSRNISKTIGVICETQPIRPSAVVSGRRSVVSSRSLAETAKNNQQSTNNQKQKANPKALRGDLDNIILKALRKEPERRYSSVEQFSEDLRRHLVGLPVSASKDTWSYRFSKFVQRNRLGVAAAGLILISLLGGLTTTIYQARIARIERAKAEQRFKDVRRLANSFMFEINEQITKSPIKARALLVERAIEYLDKLSAESGGDIELESELATAYEKIGDVQAELFKPNSGKTSEALASHRKALALREKLFAVDRSVPYAVSFADSRIKLGNILLASGQVAEARESHRAAINFLESQIAENSDQRDLQNQLGRALAGFGQAVVRSGSLGDALKSYEKSLKIYQNLAAANPEIVKFRRNLGILSSYIGFVKLEMGKTSQAIEDYERWLEIERKINAADNNDLQTQSILSTAHVWYGVALSENGNIQQAVAHFNEGVKIQEAIWAADQENLGEEYALADCLLEFGKAMVKHNLSRESIGNLEKAIEIYRKIWQKDAQNLMTRHRIANAQRFLADAYLQTKNETKALENYRQAHTVFQELTAIDPENADWRQDLAMSYRRIGEFASQKNDYAAAKTNFETALPIFEKLAATSPENIKRQNDLAAIRSNLAGLKN